MTKLVLVPPGFELWRMLDPWKFIVAQPEGSKQCGHACVAMLTGESLEKCIEVIGHTRGTRTKEIVKALRHFGLTCGDRLRPPSKNYPVPKIGIANVKIKRRSSGHWVVRVTDYIFDPSLNGYLWPLSQFEKVEEIRITSYFEVKGSVLEQLL